MSDDRIRTTCPNCGQRLVAPERMAGQVADCPTCRRRLIVPSLTPAVARLLTTDDTAPNALPAPAAAR